MPKKIDRRARKKLLIRKAWREREAAMRAEGTAWWHLFGGEVADAATREDGRTVAAWAVWVLGPSAFGADDPSPMPGEEGVTIREHVIDGPNGSKLTYRGSWDHVPSVAEVDEVTPEQYRASEGATTAPIQVEGSPDA